LELRRREPAGGPHRLHDRVSAAARRRLAGAHFSVRQASLCGFFTLSRPFSRTWYCGLQSSLVRMPRGLTESLAASGSGGGVASAGAEVCAVDAEALWRLVERRESLSSTS